MSPSQKRQSPRAHAGDDERIDVQDRCRGGGVRAAQNQQPARIVGERPGQDQLAVPIELAEVHGVLGDQIGREVPASTGISSTA